MRPIFNAPLRALRGIAIRRATYLVAVWIFHALLIDYARLERLGLAPPTVTQSASGTSSSSTTCGASFGSNVASGVRIVVCVSKHATDAGTTISGVADTHSPSTVYAEDQVSGETSGRKSFIWSGLTTVSGTTPTVTVTFSASTSSRIFIYELSNAATVDTTNDGGTNTDSGTSHTSSSSKTPSTDCVGFCALTAAAATPGIAAGSGWTLHASTTGRNGSQYRNASGSGETGPWTTSTGTAGMSAMQFYATPSAGGHPARRRFGLVPFAAKRHHESVTVS